MSFQKSIGLIRLKRNNQGIPNYYIFFINEHYTVHIIYYYLVVTYFIQRYIIEL